MRDHENNRYQTFDYVAYVDAKGDFYSDIGTQTNIVDRDYYQAIMGGAEFFIDNPVTSKTSGKTIVHISRSVKVNGRVKGFFCAVVGIQHMQELLEDVNLGDKGLAMLFSGDGQLIATNGAPDMLSVDLLADSEKEQSAEMQSSVLHIQLHVTSQSLQSS